MSLETSLSLHPPPDLFTPEKYNVWSARLFFSLSPNFSSPHSFVPSKLSVIRSFNFKRPNFFSFFPAVNAINDEIFTSYRRRSPDFPIIFGISFSFRLLLFFISVSKSLVYRLLFVSTCVKIHDIGTI